MTRFEWRKVGAEMHGITITDAGRETNIFQVFKRPGKRLSWRLYRVMTGGVEDFKTRRAAVAWANAILRRKNCNS